MKPTERLAAMRKSKVWLHKLALASDEIPGTGYDRLITEMVDALRWSQQPPILGKQTPGVVTVKNMGERVLSQWGGFLADAIKRGNSQLFRELADAIDAFHHYRPAPDPLRQCIIYFCQPRKKPFEVREIIEFLENRGFPIDDNLRRTVRRICTELGIAIKGKSGRPGKNQDKDAD